MAIFTPRGLKVRLPVDYSFALMRRLYPSVDAFKVLQTTEAFELMPNCMSFIAAIFCFLNHLNPIMTAGIVAAVHVFGHFMCISGLPADTFFVRLSTIFSVLSGYGIYLVILAAVGFFFAGWQGVMGYVAGRLLASAVNGVINHFNGKRIQKQVGTYVTMSEVNFFNAYIFHARRKKKPLDLAVSDKELDESNWRPVFMDLAAKWPQIVARFTPD
jgi:hypothetical protein